MQAVRHFESVESQFHPEAIRRHAVRFDVAVYTDQIHNFIEQRLEEHRC